MLPTSTHQSAVGQTGWAAFQWQYSANGPQFSFMAGCCDATRIQLDRYRRNLIATSWRNHWQIFCWSTRDFRLDTWDVAGMFWNRTRANQRPQQTELVDTAINDLREFRDDGPGGFAPGLFLNNFSHNTVSYQSTNVFALSYAIRPTANQSALSRDAISIEQFSPNYAPVNVVVVAFSNANWDFGNFSNL